MSGLEALDTIDKDLNYEFYDDNRYRLKTPIKVHDIFSEEIEVIRKELKALEIIKNKKVNVPLFIEEGSVYNCYVGYEVLTQDEFDLLKEVLK